MESAISIRENIARLRKERKLTQEDLASFLGVTKASVSKWETGQSYPDIELLPRVATFFDISIDELMGYEPQMSKQGIREACARLRTAFANEPFEEAHEKCQQLVRDYFSCYPLLVQIAALYLNHLGLVAPEQHALMVEETIDLCQRVRRNSDSSAHIRQAESIEALLMLSNGNARGAVELLQDMDMVDMGADVILARAHCALGQADKADEALQVMVYQALVVTLSRLAELALLHVGDHERLTLIHERTIGIIDTFDLETSYVNIATTHFMFATAFAMDGDADGAIGCLEDYERACRKLEFPLKLHGDDFFDKIEGWLEEVNDIGTSAPRDESLIKQGFVSSVVGNPAFAQLAGDARFKRIVKSLEGIAR